jgi:uncharacterized repeat protein (TIGR01451 family)
MFRKIVSNLAFSPALVGQLGFYAKRLRKEEATRRIGLIFTVLALVVQSFAVFSPPEAVNAANGDNVIYSGITSKENLLSIYDRGVDSAGRNDIRQIYTHFGVSRDDIARASIGTYYTNDFNGQIKTVGRGDWGVSNRFPVKVTDSNTTVYSGGFLDGYNGKRWPMRALIGTRAIDGQWFAITLDCGNVVYVVPPPPVKHPNAICTSLKMTPITRTKVRLTGSATVVDGASISAYTYTVKNSAGQTVSTQRVASTATTSQTDHTLPRDGTYTATLTVSTSLGDKTSNDCATSLTISPEPRCPLNPALVQSSPDCKPCEDDATIWYKDANCKPDFEIAKAVSNITQNKTNGSGTTAQPNDQLSYTLTVKNTGTSTGTYTIGDSLSDVLEYADVVDLGGGNLIKSGSTPYQPSTTSEARSLVGPAVTWPAVTLKPGESVKKVVLIRVKAAIPATGINMANMKSYDCKMSNTFGNTLSVSVACPPEKVTETVITQLPHTGATENMIFAGSVLAVVTYFYARARQTKTEVRLIRRDLHAGTI